MPSAQQEISSHRSSLLRKNVIMSFFIKAWSAVVVLLMVPLTLKCLGDYQNGLWLTISSLLLWIDNMDIGLGNGLRNKLATYMAHGDTMRARTLVSSTFAMLTCIIFPTMLVLILAIHLTDTYSLFNVDANVVTNLDAVLIVTVCMVCATFIFKLVGNFYMGLQMPAVNNLLIAAGQTLTLIATYAVYLSGTHSLMHIAIAGTAAPLLAYMAAVPITFGWLYPTLRPSISLVNMSEAKQVMSLGVRFFIMQIASVVLFATSNLLISKLFTPAMVTPYQIAYRYFSLFIVVFTVVCMPFWNATTDAYERGDINWIRGATKKLNKLTLLIVAAMAVMVGLSPIAYHIWIGDDVEIPMSVTIAMAAYIFTIIYSMRYSYFINGIGKLRLQLIFTSAAALVFIPAAWLTAKATHSIAAFIWAMTIVNLPGLIVNRIQFHKLINGKAKGLWNAA
ncbi:MAG: MATE family efflux transporter [Prevotella sp.]|nr:MATE family efflux transporter [Prevotella sp.]